MKSTILNVTESYRDTIQEALEVLHKRDLVLTIHARNLPDRHEIYGSPYSDDTREFLQFLADNGVTILQLGPLGPHMTPILPSDYETCTLFLSPFYFPLEKLSTSEYANLLPKEQLSEIAKRFFHKRVKYNDITDLPCYLPKRDYVTQFYFIAEIMEAVYRNFSENDNRDIEKIKKGLEAYKSRVDIQEDLEKASLYYALSKYYGGMDYWPLWGCYSEEFGEFIQITAPDPGSYEGRITRIYADEIKSIFTDQIVNSDRELDVIIKVFHEISKKSQRGYFKEVYSYLLGADSNGEEIWRTLIKAEEKLKTFQHQQGYRDAKTADAIYALGKLTDFFSDPAKREGLEKFLDKVDLDQRLFAQKTLPEKADARISEIKLNSEYMREGKKFLLFQYFLSLEHQSFLDFAHSLNMTISGDLPVVIPPLEVWMNPDAMDEDLRLGAPPGRSVPDAGQSWGFRMFKELIDISGHTTFAGKVFQKKIACFMNLFDHMRTDHAKRYMNPWCYRTGESADPNSKPHLTAFNLHSSPHLVHLLKLIDPDFAKKLWDEESPEILGLDSVSQWEAKNFREELHEIFTGATPYKELSFVLSKVFELEKEEALKMAFYIEEKTFISCASLNRDALSEIRKALLRSLKQGSLVPFDELWKGKDIFEANPIIIGWETAIKNDPLNKSQLERYTTELKLLMEIQRMVCSGRNITPYLFLEDLGNFTEIGKQVINTLGLTGISTVSRFRTDEGERDRYFTLNHPEANQVTIGTHDHATSDLVFYDMNREGREKWAFFTSKSLLQRRDRITIPTAKGKKKGLTQENLASLLSQDPQSLIEGVMVSMFASSPAAIVNLFWPEAFRHPVFLREVYNKVGTNKPENFSLSLPGSYIKAGTKEMPAYELLFGNSSLIKNFRGFNLPRILYISLLFKDFTDKQDALAKRLLDYARETEEKASRIMADPEKNVTALGIFLEVDLAD